MKKHFLRLLLLPAVLLTLTNCQDDFEDRQGIMPGQSAATARVLTGAEAVKMRDKIITNLKKDGNKGMQRLANTINTTGAAYKTSYEDIKPMIDSTVVLALIDSTTGKMN